MLNRIKSQDIQIIILEYLNQKQILDIFKYSNNYQKKFNLTKDDYLSYFFNKLPVSLEEMITYHYNILTSDNENGLFKELKKYTKKNISNDILKKNLIYFLAKKNDFLLSVDNIFFNEIINAKILLKQKKITKIKIKFREYLSQNKIIYLINQKKSYDEIEKYINERISEYNYLLKKLELLLNSELFIEEFCFDLNDETIFIDNKKDIIEYKENMTDKEKNILINFKLKRGELINKILEKNCKNITKLEYIVLDKQNINKELIFPLVDLEKFVNLEDLDLHILYNSQEFEHVFEFTNKLEKLKHLKIRGHNYSDFYSSQFSLSIYIKKEILDKLETLKIKKVRWFVLNNEYFHFKNLKDMNIEFFQYNDIIDIKSKKYFHEEFLNGNISWEKLKRLKINIPFGYDSINKIYKNKKIIKLINIANLRGIYDSSEEFFQEFFNFIFKNQILYLKTNKENKTIDDFIIKIHDDYGMNCSGYKPTIKYEKKLKNVNITIEGILYCENVFHHFHESPLRLIDLNNIKINSELDGFFIDNYTLDQLKKIKELILSLYKSYEDEINAYRSLYQNRDIEKELKIKAMNELNDKIDFINKKIELINEDNDNNTFEKKLKHIQKLYLLHFIDETKQIQQSIKQMKNKRKESQLSQTNYDVDFSIDNLFQ